jgi:hypothetical protein
VPTYSINPLIVIPAHAGTQRASVRERNQLGDAVAVSKIHQRADARFLGSRFPASPEASPDFMQVLRSCAAAKRDRGNDNSSYTN